MPELTVKVTSSLPCHGLENADFYSSREWLNYQLLDDSTETIVVNAWCSTGQMVVATPVFYSEKETNPMYRLDGSGTREASEPRRPRALVGNRRGYRGGLHLDASHEAAGSAVRLTLDTILAESQRRGATSVWWPYLKTSEVRALLPHVEPQVPRLLTGDCSISLPGSTFEDYLSSLPGARRREVSRERRQLLRSGLDLRTDPLEGFGPQLAELVYEHGRRHGAQASAEDVATVIARQSTTCGAVGWVASARDEAAVRSVCLSYATADEITVRAYGSQETNRSQSAYFELAYYRQIEQAYATTARSVHLGIGTLRTKVLRGARVEPLWGLRLDADHRLTSAADQKNLNHESWFQMVQESGDVGLAEVQTEIEEWI